MARYTDQESSPGDAQFLPWTACFGALNMNNILSGVLWGFQSEASHCWTCCKQLVNARPAASRSFRDVAIRILKNLP